MVKSHQCVESLDRYSMVEYLGWRRHWIAPKSIPPVVVGLQRDGRIEVSMPAHNLKGEPVRVRFRQAMVVSGLMRGCHAHQG